MSYDMGIGSVWFNYTYNVSPMWYDCYPDSGIRCHYGLTGREAVPVLLKLFNHMVLNRERLIEMEPDNGWGDYEGARDFVLRLIDASLIYPNEEWVGD